MKVILHPPKEVIDFIYNRGIVCEEHGGKYIKLPEWILIETNGTISEVPYKELPDSVKRVELRYRHPERMFTLQDMKDIALAMANWGEGFEGALTPNEYFKEHFGIDISKP